MEETNVSQRGWGKSDQENGTEIRNAKSKIESIHSKGGDAG